MQTQPGVDSLRGTGRMTERRRHDTSDPPPFRSNARIYRVGNEWYFSTREGSEAGPFETRDEAEAALVLFLRDKVTEDERIASGD